MSQHTLPTTTSALHDILGWSKDLPGWQRDALRRIVSQEIVEEADINELYSMCLSAHCADTSNELGKDIEECQPLAAVHLPPAPGAASSIALTSIGKFRNVNRLPSDQVVKFGAAPGLTIVFGDNGSGKSGYARVLKRACRSRGMAAEIRPNAFEPPPDSAASAEIAFQVAGMEQSYSWTDGVATDPRLANIFVFDSTTATHYLEQDGPAIFTPHGLDVLPKLARICDEIRTRLQSNITQLEGEIAFVEKNWRIPQKTSVGRLLSSLSASTAIRDIEELARFTNQDAQRLGVLSDALKSDAKVKARESRAAASRLRAFAEAMTECAVVLSPDQLLVMKMVVENATTTEASAKAFSAGTFDATYLNGTGSDLWRSLFEAARAFSVEEAYRGQEFPAVSEASRCLLCQQHLDSTGRERLQAFDRYCKDISQVKADEAASRLAGVIATVNLLGSMTSEYSKVEADLSLLPDEEKSVVLTFVMSCEKALVGVKASLVARAWVETSVLPSSPAAAITELAITLEQRADVEDSADDPNARAKLLMERDELAAREWLAAVKDDVVAQVTRHKQVAKLSKCQRDTNTRAITEKSIQLTQQIITEAFCKRFGEESTAIGLRTLSVKMEEIKGRKGETRFGLRLEGASGSKVHEIASEGEQRCVALAAFLAELSQASHHSTLVFDDPVSSLDHWHHQRIAERLAREAGVRQVIVFTHSTSFLHDLQHAARDSNVELCILHLEWGDGVPGKCREGLPWDWKTADERFDKLEKRQREISTQWNPCPNEVNVQDVRQVYSWLRATLERIVEKEVLSDVVFRFREYIKVQNLGGVVGFSAQECSEIQRLMQRCHDVTEAHDPSPGKHAPIPGPSELLKDIEATRAVFEVIKKRKKACTPSGASVPRMSSTGNT
jgi:energy-coupling factor transporter ATP-binding protein EcfA2